MKLGTTAAVIAVAWCGMGLIAPAADAASAPVTPKQVCVDDEVRPLNLVDRLLTAYAVQRGDKPDQLDPKQVLKNLADPKIPLDPQRMNSNLLHLLADTEDMLDGHWKKQFQPPAGSISPKQYFEDPKTNAIRCVGNDQAMTQPSEPQVRLRGTTDDLIFAKDENGFTGASKSSLSFSYNGINKTRTDQIVAVLGYSLPIGEGAEYTLVPYIGGNRNVSNTTGAPEKVSSDTINFGVVGIAKDWPFANAIVSISPDFLMDLNDDSRIASLHPILTPQYIGVLNNAIYLPSVFGSYLTILADLRADLGIYTDRGNAKVAPTNTDFARVGSKFGFDIALKNWYDFAITDTYLHGFAGSRKTLNDFQSSFTFYFGMQNVLGLTASYKNGLLEQTAKREQSWTIGLTAKY